MNHYMHRPYNVFGIACKNGGPTVQGGMDEEAYARLQAEERAFQAEQSELSHTRALEIQAAEREREAAAVGREERIRQAEEDALEKMENEVGDNITAMNKAEADLDKDIVMDFYSSLAKGDGSGKRPE